MPDAYYVGLVTSQYQNSPKMLAWLLAKIAKLDDIANCLAQFNTAFSIQYAVGAQLDLLGTIIGQGRTVGFQPSAGASPTLNDPDYRLLLLARIGQNQWNGSFDGLQGTWAQLFPQGKIIIDDNQNMTATIIMTGAFTQMQQDLINNGYIVPRPEGVLYTYTFAALPLFGFGAQNQFISGFGSGKWG